MSFSLSPSVCLLTFLMFSSCQDRTTKPKDLLATTKSKLAKETNHLMYVYQVVYQSIKVPNCGAYSNHMPQY